MSDKDNVVKPPRWTWGKKTVTITMDREWLLAFAADLNEWESHRWWTRRADCQNWKRSPIARENRRESITYSNCLGMIQVLLGRREVRKAMQKAREETHTHERHPDSSTDNDS